MTVVATAGHVDHGKSTLVQALTGIDPDRFTEEKERGMTLDLGFATVALPSGNVAEFVDVPGHSRYLKNMLSGVGSAAACVFVVAATEGWKAQSEEHLRILDLLGVPAGMVALTKSALAGRDATASAAAEVRARVAGTFLEGAEVVAVDVPAGEGVGDVEEALDRLLGSLAATADLGRPRLWVDRSFAIRGAGCVVTGTLTGGALAAGQAVCVEPGGRPARVKALQVNHQPVPVAGPGHRVAVNLAGVSHHDVLRGHALVEPRRWHVTRSFDATVSVVASLGSPLGTKGAFTVSIGSGEHPLRLRFLGGERSIEPGATGLARLTLESPPGLPLLPGDRYVLREAGRSALVGGGEILDVAPVLPRRKAAPVRSAQRVVDERGWVDADELERLTGERLEPTVGRWVMSAAVARSTRARLVEMARDAGPGGADPARLDQVERDVLDAGVDGVVLRNGRLFPAGSPQEELSGQEQQALRLLESQPFQPPDLPLSERGVLRSLERRGLAFETDGIWFATSALPAAVAVLRPVLERGASVSEARQALGTTRKYALPLLKHLDSCGITRRHDDRRTAGPRISSYG